MSDFLTSMMMVVAELLLLMGSPIVCVVFDAFLLWS